jgi:transposase InsO family protein
MSGKGNCYDNSAVETFFTTIKAELIWPSSNTSTSSINLAVGIQHLGKNAPWPSNAKWPKRGLEAARKRNKISLDLHRFRSGLLRALLALKETGYGSDTQ